MSDAKLLSDLRNPKWSRFKDTGALAANRIEALSHEVEYWKDLWQKAATRVLQIEPEVNSKSTTVVDRIRKLEGVVDEKKRNPNPWSDV